MFDLAVTTRRPVRKLARIPRLATLSPSRYVRHGGNLKRARDRDLLRARLKTLRQALQARSAASSLAVTRWNSEYRLQAVPACTQ